MYVTVIQYAYDVVSIMARTICSPGIPAEAYISLGSILSQEVLLVEEDLELVLCALDFLLCLHFLNCNV